MSPAPRVGSTARSVRSWLGWSSLATSMTSTRMSSVVARRRCRGRASVSMSMSWSIGDSARRPTPAGDPDEQAAASPKPTSRIAAAGCDPARRTARTVPGAGGRWGASALLDDSHKPSRLRKVTSSERALEVDLLFSNPPDRSAGPPCKFADRWLAASPPLPPSSRSCSRARSRPQVWCRLPHPPPGSRTVNAYRAMSGLGPVTENTTWSAEGQAHSCYMLHNGISHDEVPGNPGYTPVATPQATAATSPSAAAPPPPPATTSTSG